MKTRHVLGRVATAVVLAATLACASRRAARLGTEVSASNLDVSPLVGRWSGESVNAQTGRTGTIAFTLEAREERASGEIVLRPSVGGDSAHVIDGAGVAAPSTRQVLRIDFVRLEGNNVVGRIEPYVNAACNCRVSSTFRGVLQGNTIEGTFEAVGTDDPSLRFTGSWKVTRVKRL
jgi:hypothetical protein